MYLTTRVLLLIVRSIITSLLQKLPHLFSRNKNPEPTLLPTLESAVSSLAATGGKIVCSLASLPTWGPGRLFLRDKNDLHGIETEKKLFQTEHPAWKKLAAKMVESGVGIDYFIAAAGGKYMDIATIGGDFLQVIYRITILTTAFRSHICSLWRRNFFLSQLPCGPRCSPVVARGQAHVDP